MTGIKRGYYHSSHNSLGNSDPSTSLRTCLKWEILTVAPPRLLGRDQSRLAMTKEEDAPHEERGKGAIADKA